MLRAILENSAGDGKYLVDVASSTAGGETEFGLSSRQVHQFIAANAAKSNYQGPKWAKIGEQSVYDKAKIALRYLRTLLLLLRRNGGVQCLGHHQACDGHFLSQFCASLIAFVLKKLTVSLQELAKDLTEYFQPLQQNKKRTLTDRFPKPKPTKRNDFALLALVTLVHIFQEIKKIEVASSNHGPLSALLRAMIKHCSDDSLEYLTKLGKCSYERNFKESERKSSGYPQSIDQIKRELSTELADFQFTIEYETTPQNVFTMLYTEPESYPKVSLWSLFENETEPEPDGGTFSEFLATPSFSPNEFFSNWPNDFQTGFGHHEGTADFYADLANIAREGPIDPALRDNSAGHPVAAGSNVPFHPNSNQGSKRRRQSSHELSTVGLDENDARF
ncbi:MAG: hypothetical protein MMC23_005742 [Stictis urceolatum]|nr:hypothetical protein [Stictis urceolata]